MPGLDRDLLRILLEARELLGRTDNDFTWSSWEGAPAALREIDGFIEQIRSNRPFDLTELRCLFSPTGPIQEVSVSSGWSQEFLVLADQFERAVG